MTQYPREISYNLLVYFQPTLLYFLLFTPFQSKWALRVRLIRWILGWMKEKTLLMVVWLEIGEEKKLVEPEYFLPEPIKMFLFNLGRKLKKKLHANQIPDLPLSFQCVWLCILFMHWITFTLCSFFLFNVLLFYSFFFFLMMNLYYVFIQSFKQLLLHFLAFCFSLFLIMWWY